MPLIFIDFKIVYNINLNVSQLHIKYFFIDIHFYKYIRFSSINF